MTLALDYSTPGVAAADKPLWGATNCDVDSYGSPVSLYVQATDNGATAMRPVTGLVIGEDYRATVTVHSFSESNHWTVSAGGVTVSLAVGAVSVDFTATSTTENVAIAYTADAGDYPSVFMRGFAVDLTSAPVEPPAPLVVTGSGLRLRDKVEIVTADTYEDGHGNTEYDWDNPIVVGTLPAYVGYTTTGLFAGEDGRTAFVEELRAITPAFNFDPVAHRLRWKGETYLPNGPALLRMRNGRDHHLTIPIKAVNG